MTNQTETKLHPLAAKGSINSPEAIEARKAKFAAQDAYVRKLAKQLASEKD